MPMVNIESQEKNKGLNLLYFHADQNENMNKGKWVLGLIHRTGLKYGAYLIKAI